MRFCKVGLLAAQHDHRPKICKQEVIFKKSCLPCLKLAKFNEILLAMTVLKPEYENITLSHMRNSASRFSVSTLTT